MEGANRGKALWKTMKQRLGFNAISICGSSWSLQTSDNNNNDQISAPVRRRGGLRQIPEETTTATAAGMNLAMALAAERGRNGPDEESVGKPFRSLLGQLQGSTAADGHDPAKRRRGIGEEIEGFDCVCCVCMERKKDAAFIPCGHTYCRVCSRELWLNRGCCPLCNCSITDVLDIF